MTVRTPIQMVKWNAAQRLRRTRDELRAAVHTEPDHAIPHHRADELLRDLLEEVLHEDDGPSESDRLMGLLLNHARYRNMACPDSPKGFAWTCLCGAVLLHCDSLGTAVEDPSGDPFRESLITTFARHVAEQWSA